MKSNLKSFSNKRLFLFLFLFITISFSNITLAHWILPINVEKEKHVNQPLLDQNYPNPFNPSTSRKWYTPLGGHQTLKVFDTLGNEIKTLRNEYKSDGHYKVRRNG